MLIYNFNEKITSSFHYMFHVFPGYAKFMTDGKKKIVHSEFKLNVTGGIPLWNMKQFGSSNHLMLFSSFS
jgi:hypothetical protein